MYNVHLVAVQAAPAPVQDQLLPHATPLIFVILGLAEVQAVQAAAAQDDRAQPLPHATSIFRDHWFSNVHAVHGLFHDGRVPPAVQLFPFLLIVPLPDNVHFTNILYQLGSKTQGLVIVKLL